MEPYRTKRWRGIVAVALGTLSVGLLATEPALVLLAVVVVGFAVVPHVYPDPPTTSIDLERSVTPLDPSPGEPVVVELSIRNEGERSITDLRIVDGVPPLATVVDGTPRLATALGPGATATIRYRIAIDAGKHRFGPTTLVRRNLGGSVERAGTEETPTVIDCGDRDVSAPLTSFVSHLPGPIPADSAGAGVEFYGTRDATSGEAIDRIDWRRFARTGDLVSVEFRPERAANVVLCVDPLGPSTTDPPSVVNAPALAVRCLTVADGLLTALGAENHAVGLATPGAEGIWIPPGMGRTHVDRIRTVLETDPVFAPPVPGGVEAGATRPAGSRVTGPSLVDGRSNGMAEGTPDGGIEQVGGLDERIGPDAQVLLVSPVLDERIVELALACTSPRSHRVTVISPEPPTDAGISSRLTRLVRVTRIRALRSQGVRVFEWSADEPLSVAARAWKEGEEEPLIS